MFRRNRVVGGVAIVLDQRVGVVIRARWVQRDSRDEVAEEGIDRRRQIPVVQQPEERVDVGEQVQRIGGEVRPHVVLASDIVGREDRIGREGRHLARRIEKPRQKRQPRQKTPVGTIRVSGHDERHLGSIGTIGEFGCQCSLFQRSDDRALGVSEHRHRSSGTFGKVLVNLGIEKFVTGVDRVVEGHAEQSGHRPEFLRGGHRGAEVPLTQGRRHEPRHHLADPLSGDHRFEGPAHDQCRLRGEEFDPLGVSGPQFRQRGSAGRERLADSHLQYGDQQQRGELNPAESDPAPGANHECLPRYSARQRTDRLGEHADAGKRSFIGQAGRPIIEGKLANLHLTPGSAALANVSTERVPDPSRRRKGPTRG